MEPQNTPRETPQGADLDTRVLAWLQLKEQMQQVHAQLEYVKLMLKLGMKE
jgi:hypothetical protein